MDLSDAAERLQVAGEIGPAHRDADAVAALGQRAHHMAAEKARAAEDGDQRVGGDSSHAVLVDGGQSGAEYSNGPALYRGGNRRIDKAKAAAVPIAASPGGGIGRRTSFRY